jgi:serine/threonine protein kinase
MSESLSEVPSARALEVGSTLGHYRIVAFIGAGGMGEVYRAHDARLGRDVAVKVLPAIYDGHAERVRRFMQEAKTTGRITHPNVVSVFDAGELDRRPYLVTELLEGDTLRSYLQKHAPLPVRQVVEFGIQMARGLAAAHDKGVIHRDLKPANVYITGDGHLKILDFGLAKLVQPEFEHSDADTISALSIPGTVLGSAGYMSPEQIEARPVDSRSDLFSLGAILYEMLTGVRAFSASSVAATLGAILKDDPPDVLKVRPRVPASLALIVRRCLEKRAEARFQSARDLAFSLEELMTRSDVSLSSAAVSAIRTAALTVTSKPLASVSVAAVLAVLVVVGVAMQSRSSAQRAIQTSDNAPMPEIVRITSSGRGGGGVAMSPDGKYIACVRQSELWLIHVPTASETRLLAQPVSDPTFSPDGNYIYFNTSENDVALIARIPILGGAVHAITRNVASAPFTLSPDGARIAFLRDEKEIAGLRARRAIFVTSSTGADERRLTKPEDGRGFFACAWSPDGVRLACSVDREEAIDMVEVNPATGAVQPQPQLHWLLGPSWMPDGKALVGASRIGLASQIWAVSYPEGKPSRLTNDLSEYFGASVSRDGSAIAAERTDMTTNLWVAPLEAPGAGRRLTTGVNTYDGNYGISTTPDGRIVWASGATGKSIDLWISDADGANRRRLTTDDGASEKFPDVSPDGKTVVYIRESSGGRDGEVSDVWRIDLDGVAPRQLTTGKRVRYAHVDGNNRVLFNRAAGDDEHVWQVPLSGGDATPFLEERTAGVRRSPDGKWLLVGVRDDKGARLELRSTTTEERRVFPYWGIVRKWRPDSLSFGFIRNGNLWLQELSSNAPRKLTNFGAQGEFLAFSYAWTPDGKSFVYAQRNSTQDIVVLKLGPRRAS